MMNSARSIRLGYAFLMVGLSTLAVTVNGADSDGDYGIIFERNVFDPARRPVSRVENVRPPTPPAPAPSPKTLCLTGVLIRDGEPVAFFSSRDYLLGGAVKPGDQVAVFQISEISTCAVKLHSEDVSFTLKPGQQLTDQASGDWTIDSTYSPPVSTSRSGPGGPRGFGGPGRPGGSSGSEAEPASEPAGDVSDILKRMRERRLKELGK